MKSTPARPVLDGQRVKWTLEQAQAKDPGLVRLDWLRFTLPVSAVVAADSEHALDLEALGLLDKRGRDLVRQSWSADDVPDGAVSVARVAAGHLLALLPQGLGFSIGQCELRGMDYYAARAEVLCHGEVVGFVLAGSKRANQAATVHFNLFGLCMLHLGRSEYVPLHAWISRAKGWITRADLALDIWTGASVLEAEDEYKAGGFDVRGKRPGARNHGCWTLKHSRTFEVGSRETGKLCRVYEKGHQLFGAESNDPWLRYEVEFRNNNRILDLALLLRPGDFFAGAYQFLADKLSQAKAEFVAERIPTKPKLAEVSAQAAVLGVARYVQRVALPAFVCMFEHAGDMLETMILRAAGRKPGKLRGFDVSAIKKAFATVQAGYAPTSAPLIFSGA